MAAIAAGLCFLSTLTSSLCVQFTSLIPGTKNHVIKKYKLDDFKGIFDDIDKTDNMESDCKSFLDRVEKFKEESSKLKPLFNDVKNIWDLRGTYDPDTLMEEVTNMNMMESQEFLKLLEQSCIGEEKQEKIKEIKSRSEVILSLEEGSDEIPGECANLTLYRDDDGIDFPSHEWDYTDKKFVEKNYDFIEQVGKICEGAEQRTNNENTQDNE
jgi:hypothetical protein|tara:strand:- start:12816 stop:13451 length:636 start_codon:yes stop_codon:yes gene_type:complete